jgi:hypothetical protein
MFSRKLISAFPPPNPSRPGNAQRHQKLYRPKKSLQVDSFQKKSLITKREEGFYNCEIDFILRKEDVFPSFHSPSYSLFLHWMHFQDL